MREAAKELHMKIVCLDKIRRIGEERDEAGKEWKRRREGLL